MLLVAETKYYGFSTISENWGTLNAGMTRLLQIIHKCSLEDLEDWSLNKFTIKIKISKLEYSSLNKITIDPKMQCSNVFFMNTS